MKEVQLGEFEITSGRILLSDPCYDFGTWCTQTVDGKNGTWRATSIQDGVCHELIACHQSYGTYMEGDWKKLDESLGVDSGQCGIYDVQFYNVKPSSAVLDEFLAKVEEDWLSSMKIRKPWYFINCVTTMTELRCGVIPYGCVSSSGYGDGGYNAYAQYNDDIVVALKIIFIEPEMENDEW